MKIYLYSYNFEIVSRWQKLLRQYETQIVKTEKTLEEKSSSIVVMCADSNFTNLDKLIKKLIKNRNKLLVLSRTPSFEEAKRWLQKGVLGYGNSMMSISFFNSSIDALLKDYIWLPPWISTQFLKEITQEEPSITNEDKILESLSKAELKVALLLKEGFTNIKISQELEISINTVKTHIKRVYEKLNVKDRLSFAKLFRN